MDADLARAEALDRVVDGLVSDRPAPVPEGLAAEAAVAERVRGVLNDPLPEGVALRHLALMRAALGPASGRRTRHRRARLIVVAATLTLFALGGSAVAASASALPGDLLYPVKRARERVTLAIERDQGERAKLHLGFAGRRLEELSALHAARRGGEDVDVGAAMSAYAAELAAAEESAGLALGGDRGALLAHVLAQIDKHVQRLMELLDTKENPNARDAIQRAIDNSQKAKERVGFGQAGDAQDARPGRGRESAPGQNKPSPSPPA